MQGQGPEGLTQIHQGMVRQQELGEVLPQPYYAAILAEASLQIGQPEAGLSIVAEALAAVYAHGHHFYTAELHRLQGELILLAAGCDPPSDTAMLCCTAKSPGERAEVCFSQALVVARRQQAKSLELRAAMSLASLWQRRGQPATAYAVLAP